MSGAGPSGGTGLRALLPPQVACRESTVPLDRPVPTQEWELVARAVPRRRAEFVTGRELARRAGSDLGRRIGAIGRDRHGAPLWPPGLIGSITHCPGRYAAALALTGQVTGLGVDATPATPLPEGVPGAIGHPADEIDREVAGLVDGRGSPVPASTVLFSAKEAFYKAWYPRGGRVLGFRDVSVRLHADGTFHAGVRRADVEAVELDGRWAVDGDVVVTAVVVLR